MLKNTSNFEVLIKVFITTDNEKNRRQLDVNWTINVTLVLSEIKKILYRLIPTTQLWPCKAINALANTHTHTSTLKFASINALYNHTLAPIYSQKATHSDINIS